MPVMEGLEIPMAVRFAPPPDGRVFVAESRAASGSTAGCSTPAGDGTSSSSTQPDWGQLPGVDGFPANACGDPPGEGGSMRSQDARSPADPTGLSGAILRVDPATGDGAPGNPFAGGDAGARRLIAYRALPRGRARRRLLVGARLVDLGHGVPATSPRCARCGAAPGRAWTSS